MPRFVGGISPSACARADTVRLGKPSRLTLAPAACTSGRTQCVQLAIDSTHPPARGVPAPQPRPCAHASGCTTSSIWGTLWAPCCTTWTSSSPAVASVLSSPTGSTRGARTLTATHGAIGGTQRQRCVPAWGEVGRRGTAGCGVATTGARAAGSRLLESTWATPAPAAPGRMRGLAAGAQCEHVLLPHSPDNQVVCELHARHWAYLADLESLNTYPQRL